MSTDRIPSDVFSRYCDAILETLGDDVPRHAAVLVSADAEPWIATQDALVDHFVAMGCSVVAKRVRRMLVPTGHILVVIAETDVRIGVIDLRDDDEPTVETTPAAPTGATALGVLGSLARTP